MGAVAIKKDRIPFSKSLNKKKVFQDGDVKLIYTLNSTGDAFQFRGDLSFDRSLTDSFEVIKRFYLNMSFLDPEGRVLETVDVTPQFSIYSMSDVNKKVARSGTIPQGATAIVFNYFGEFKGDRPEKKDDWDIHYFPFE